MSKLPIYLDTQATGRIDNEVWSEMTRYSNQRLVNPHSMHIHGEKASKITQSAIETISDFIGALPSETILLSGATIANNLALQGIEYLKLQGRDKIIVSAIEHPCVRETAKFMEKHRGFKVITIPVDSEGFVEKNAFSAALDKTVAIVSIMLGNNEIGTIQDLHWFFGFLR